MAKQNYAKTRAKRKRGTMGSTASPLGTGTEVWKR